MELNKLRAYLETNQNIADIQEDLDQAAVKIQFVLP
jgi:hypothetical protein